ncbi:hypothetical protein HGRIS_000211 [Hohenbuehelia grisea]|uniref:Uncharacterized protein n=1 Tax=Hohenbuehelia grisea TaxID=104357 RepID=A0ABR3JRJ5_9AGAR
MPQTSKRERASRFDKQVPIGLAGSAAPGVQVVSPRLPPTPQLNVSLPPFPPQFSPRSTQPPVQVLTQGQRSGNLEPSPERTVLPSGGVSRRDTYIPEDITIVATLPPERQDIEADLRERRLDDRRPDPSRDRRTEYDRWPEHRRSRDEPPSSSRSTHAAEPGGIDRTPTLQAYPRNARDRGRDEDYDMDERKDVKERESSSYAPPRRGNPPPAAMDVSPPEPVVAPRKREPLPSQTSQFRTNKKAATATPSGPREPSNRYSNANSAAPPSGPRHNAYQGSHAVEQGLGRRGAESDRMDVDEHYSSPQLPPSRNEGRATGGSTDANAQDLPRGPRAMVGRNPPHPSPRPGGPASSPVIPTQPGPSRRQAREHDGERGRSPPPHMVSRADRERRDEHDNGWPRGRQAEGMNGRDSGGRHGDEAAEDSRNGEKGGGIAEGDRSLRRREPRQRGRSSRGVALSSGNEDMPDTGIKQSYQQDFDARPDHSPTVNPRRPSFNNVPDAPYPKISSQDEASYRDTGRDSAYEPQRQYRDPPRRERGENDNRPGSSARRDSSYRDAQSPPPSHQRQPKSRSWSSAEVSPDLRENAQPSTHRHSPASPPSPIFEDNRPSGDGPSRRSRKSRFGAPRANESVEAEPWADRGDSAQRHDASHNGALNGSDVRRQPDLQARLSDRSEVYPGQPFPNAGLPPKPSRRLEPQGDRQPDRRVERNDGAMRRDRGGQDLEWEEDRRRRSPQQSRMYSDAIPYPDRPQARTQADEVGYMASQSGHRDRDSNGPTQSRPPALRTSSLLDRLSMPDPDSLYANGSSTSERVDLPMKRDRDVSDSPAYGRHPSNAVDDYEEYGESKRRKRSRRGRRAGA